MRAVLRWGLLFGLLAGLWLLASSLAWQARASSGEGDRAGAAAEAARVGFGPTVVMISLDGTRPADLTEERLPSLVALARKGAVAEALVPVDPTNTFPNHVSLATGVRPEDHGMVNNTFVDPVRGRFTRDAPNTWIESEPIWSIAERHGLPTASYFWVGSEGPWSGGPGPNQTRKFSSRTLEKTKVNRILKWLALPDPAERPRLIVAWFHGADHASHDWGPESKEVTDSLAPQDAQIARLVREMEARGLFATTTLVFVSDHGMVEAERRIDVARKLREGGVRAKVLGIGGFASIVFDPKKRSDEKLAQTVSILRELGLEAWRREEAPRDWHVDHPRFGDVVVRAPVGVAIAGRSVRIDGFHGYDAEHPSMAGLLVARGPTIEPGTKLGRVSSLAVAPTVLEWLALPIPVQMQTPPLRALTKSVARPPEAQDGQRDESRSVGRRH